MRRVRRYVLASDVPCIPRVRHRPERAHSVSGQERRRQDRFVRAHVPVLQRAGPASAMFRAV